MNQRNRGIVTGAALGAAGLLAGGVLATTLSASADDGASPGTSSGTSSGTTGSSSTTQQGRAPDGRAPRAGALPGNGDPSQPQRPDEKLLTGTTLDKVTAVVEAEYPDATFQRVETDSDGVYEAHLLVDGQPLTVEVGKDFAITGTESRPAPPDAGSTTDG